MKALLIVAHGSRRAASNEEVRRVASQAAERLRADWDRIGCGFLELAEPSIPDALEAMISEGAREITVVPWFLAAGRHVQEDIPAEVEKVRERHPEVRIRITPHLGSTGTLIEALPEIAGREGT